MIFFLYFSFHTNIAISCRQAGLLMFLAAVGLRGLGDDGGRRVAVMHVTRTRTHHPRCRTTLQPESGSQCRQRRNQYGDDDLDNLCSSHNFKIF